MSEVPAHHRPSELSNRQALVRFVAWLLLGAAVVGMVGFISVLLTIRAVFAPLPELHRPSDVAEGSASIQPASPPVTVAIVVAVSRQAVDAAAAGDGLVHFELDVGGRQRHPVDIEVGVNWQQPSPQTIRPLAHLTPGGDVRWTYRCSTDRPCERVLELAFALSDRQKAAVDLEWRLVAEVRPPRGTVIARGATVELILAEDAE